MTFTKKVKYKFNCLAIFEILNRGMKKIIFILGLWLYLFSIKVNATVIFVDIIHIGGTQTGTSWATAFSDFQAGINAAHAGDSVWVARGTYQPAAHASFSMKEGVKIFGGFQNTDLLFNERNWQNDSTILAGNQGHVIDNSMNNLTAASMIDGFIIKDGYADYGGGIYNISSSPVIVNVSLHTNMAKLRGGGMYNSNASPALSNVIIYDNTADIMFGDGWGGGMYNENASPVLTNVRITNNLGYRGGGIYNEHSNPVLTNVVVKGNTVGNLTLGFGLGGGIYNEVSSPVLTGVDITDNLAGWGGGMYNISNSSPSLDNVTINDNIASHSGAGGGMYNGNGSSPTLTNVTINGNKALYQGNGGGMYNINNSSPVLNYVTISNNTAGLWGGGIYNDSSSPILNHVRITGDSATNGGGIFNYYIAAPVLNDVIISENVATGNGEFLTGAGGGMANYSSFPLLTDVTFENNMARGGDRCGYGGAVFNSGSSVTMVNVMIRGNKAVGTFAGGWGGGILCSNSFLTLTNVVIADNTATGDDYGGCGGGIHNNDNGTVFSRLTNVTICNNTAITGGGMYNNSSSPILNNCIIYGNNTGVFNTDGASAPRYFYSLIQSMPIDPTNHNLGGATNPLFDNPASGDYRLRFNSPCINQGNNDSIPGGIVTDLAGNNRIAYNIVDMGAYEYKLAVSLGNDTTLCSNGAMLYAGNTGSSYFWNTGATTQSIPVTVSGTYIVSVSNTWGIVTDTISVEIVPSPVVNLGNDITTGLPSYTLDAGNAGAAYLWNTGATTQTITVNVAGVYSVTVTNGFGCSATDTITVSFQPVGIPTVTASGNGLVITPNPAGGMVRITIADGKLLHTKAMLTDAYGRVVRTVMMESKSQQLSLAGLAQGIYILKMENGATAKMVKE